MTNKPQIDEPTCAVKTLADASNALERAEFIDAVPELQAPNGYIYFVGDSTGYMSGDDFRACIHPAVSDYMAAMRAAPRTRPNLTSNLRRQRRQLQERYDGSKANYIRCQRGRVNDAFQGGLRRLIDAYMWNEFALQDLRAVELEIAKENRAKRKAKWKEQQKRRQQLRSMGLMS